VSEEVKKCEEQCESEEKKQSEYVSLSLSTLALFFVDLADKLSNPIKTLYTVYQQLMTHAKVVKGFKPSRTAKGKRKR
jgi:hypothetical protein